MSLTEIMDRVFSLPFPWIVAIVIGLAAVGAVVFAWWDHIEHEREQIKKEARARALKRHKETTRQQRDMDRDL